MTKKEDELDESKKDKKPDLKVISFEEKKKEKEELTYEDIVFETYIKAKCILDEINDHEKKEEAFFFLKKAFMLAIDPFEEIDEQFEIEVEYYDE